MAHEASQPRNHHDYFPLKISGLMPMIISPLNNRSSIQSLSASWWCLKEKVTNFPKYKEGHCFPHLTFTIIPWSHNHGILYVYTCLYPGIIMMFFFLSLPIPSKQNVGIYTNYCIKLGWRPDINVCKTGNRKYTFPSWHIIPWNGNNWKYIMYIRTWRDYID